MSKILIGLLVGVHFHPPAKLLLEGLAGDTKLILEPEPENPYDAEAILVKLDPTEIPEVSNSFLEDNLPSAGCTLEQLLNGGEVILGHVGTSAGKPITKARAKMPELAASLVGNKEFLDAMKQPAWSAKLGFASTGAPVVMLTVEEE